MQRDIIPSHQSATVATNNTRFSDDCCSSICACNALATGATTGGQTCIRLSDVGLIRPLAAVTVSLDCFRMVRLYSKGPLSVLNLSVSACHGQPMSVPPSLQVAFVPYVSNAERTMHGTAIRGGICRRDCCRWLPVPATRLRLAQSSWLFDTGAARLSLSLSTWQIGLAVDS